MKRNSILRLILCGLLLAGVVFWGGCAKKTMTDDDSIQLESNLLKGQGLFADQIENRGNSPDFEIVDVTVTEKTLKVKVKGGGPAASYRFVWDGMVQESYPMGVRLVLNCDHTGADADTDPASSIRTLSLNLQKIIGDRPVDDFRFFVINGSKIQTAVTNPDGTVSNEDK